MEGDCLEQTQEAGVRVWVGRGCKGVLGTAALYPCSRLHGGTSLLTAQLPREGLLLTRFEFNNSLLLQEYSFHGNVSARIAIKLYDS